MYYPFNILKNGRGVKLHSPPSTDQFKNSGREASTPSYIFMAWYLITSAQGQRYGTLGCSFLNFTKNNSNAVLG
jgi:hypothetical protein